MPQTLCRRPWVSKHKVILRCMFASLPSTPGERVRRCYLSSLGRLFLPFVLFKLPRLKSGRQSRSHGQARYDKLKFALCGDDCRKLPFKGVVAATAHIVTPTLDQCHLKACGRFQRDVFKQLQKRAETVASIYHIRLETCVVVSDAPW